MEYDVIDYEMNLDFLRREIVRDLVETMRYKEQTRFFSVVYSHLPTELRPSPLRRENYTNYYVKPYKPIPISK